MVPKSLPRDAATFRNRLAQLSGYIRDARRPYNFTLNLNLTDTSRV